MAGVGVGTIARYNRVMNSGSEELKQKAKSLSPIAYRLAKHIFYIL